MMHVCFIIPFKTGKTEIKNRSQKGRSGMKKRKSTGGKKKRLLNAAAFGFIAIALVLVCSVMILWTDVYVSTDPEKEKADNGSAEERGGQGEDMEDTEGTAGIEDMEEPDAEDAEEEDGTDFGRLELSRSADGYYEIYNAEDYEAFMRACSSQSAGMICGKLMEDIYVNDISNIRDWRTRPPYRGAPGGRYFYGILDGSGHTIYGLYSAYGYGMAQVNYGTIKNLTIKDSLIRSVKEAGGICRRNYGKIEQCCFQGELVCTAGVDEVRSMAGICNENKSGGSIDMCRYAGEMRILREAEADAEPGAEKEQEEETVVLAGICTGNKGKIANCCNLVKNTAGKTGYAITDRGAVNCYTGKDSGWIRGEDNECLELEKDRYVYAPYYMKKDWYGLYLAQQGAEEWESWGGKNRDGKAAAYAAGLTDRLAVYFIQKIMVYRNLDFSELTVEAEGRDSEHPFVLRLGDEAAGEQMMIAKYAMEETVFEDERELWRVCDELLSKIGQEGWEHKTWQILPKDTAGMPAELSGKLIFYQCGGQEGMFYALPDALYRMIFNGNDYDGKFLWQIAGGLPEITENPEGKGKQPHIWQIPILAFAGEGLIGNGVAWNNREKEAVYRNMGWEEDYPASAEDILTIEKLDLNGIPLKNLGFTEEMKNLSYLSASGCGLTEIPAWEKMDRLKYLNLERNEIRDISSLANCPSLENLILSDNGISDAAVLKELGRLRYVTLEGNPAEDSEPGREYAQRKKEPVIGTWKTWTGGSSSAVEKWTMNYFTCFSPDGQVVHYGHRNVDKGSWERKDGNTVVAVFDRCTYMGPGGEKYTLPEYRVTYRFESEYILQRSTDRKRTFYASAEEEGKTVYHEVSDFDNYNAHLFFESEACKIEDEYGAFYTADFPAEGEFVPKLEKRLIETAEELAQGKEVELEQADLPYDLRQTALYDITGDGKEELFVYVSMLPGHMNNYSGATYILSRNEQGIYTVLAKNTHDIYSELLAPDGTVLLEDSIYRGASSWKGGTRIHLGYRNGEIVVDKTEHYWFHWDLPLMNWVNDYKNGKHNVYIARNPSEGERDQYGWYIELEESLKIDEEAFQPKLLLFDGFTDRDEDYPARYYQWSPFSENWWEAGGRYSEEDGENYAYWIEEAADDHPDELLAKAVEQSGLVMEKKAYPWTEETKKNVTDILRCPVADYYYESEDYAAEYVRGSILFYQKSLYEDVSEEESPWSKQKYKLEDEKRQWNIIWYGAAEEAPPAVSYQAVLAEFERLWKADESEMKAECPEGYGKYAGMYYVTAWCGSKNKENWQLCYSLADLSGEGIDELLIGMRYTGGYRDEMDDDGILQAVFTCQGGEITNIFHDENMGSQYWGLCEGNAVEISRAVAGYGDYWYYRLKPYGTEAEMTDTFGYDAGIGEDGQLEYDYYDSEKEPITEAEYKKKLSGYQPVKIQWQMLDGFMEEGE